MELSDEALAAVTLLLSGERLGTFLTLAGSPRPAIALHQQTLRVAGSLMCVMAIVEIALRNAVCYQLAAYFGTSDWLRSPPAPFVWREQERTRIGEAIASAQRAAYNQRAVQFQQHITRVERRQIIRIFQCEMGHEAVSANRQQ